MTEKEKQRLEKLNEKITQMKAQQQAIIARDKERARKERTRRLIQNGALAEQYLNCKDMPPDEFEHFLNELVKIPAILEVIKKKNEPS
ncbi:hypothetical protein LJC42_00405 [Eubacteriales bacterium OttesenSCG-928-K08]|nr:hypothetical protein [Eubacteriales bacterium OttesenSCG-928-K08]